VQLCGLGWISSSGVDDDVGTLEEGLDEAESEAAVGAGDWVDGRDRVSGRRAEWVVREDNGS
jgi:hypothetical protein